ncbi:ELMO domain-containing protein 2-like isoform X8 [Camellia sinensis]|uniref:ELMO domain-containing protein 2-like isoform X8 n=1 Tax=Camellia sinensis TaxID=4442 RepID=UPI001035F63D|nr:ELMO domain-containing protein 2-like isoform X8 [Camellia sinensis]
MSVDRTQGSCVTIRTLPPLSSLSRCVYSSSDDATFGSPTRMGKGLTCVCFKSRGTYERICINLTPLQEERLRRLKHRMKVNFDASRVEHQEGLKALWSATYPGQELHGLVSDQWKEMGWQGKDPSTDFSFYMLNRGAGFISLENSLFFAKTFSTSFQCLLKKQGGKRAAWEYPFAVAGQNPGRLSELFSCRCCQDVLKSTRAQLEKELLMDDVLRIEDMPSYTLLF